MRAIRSVRNIPNRVRETDNLILLLLGIGLALAVTLAFPQLIPRIRTGSICTDLPSPTGGNNRSLLALYGGDPQQLGLEVRLASDSFTQGQEIEVDVVFRNRDMGPIILYIPKDRDVVFGNPALESGVVNLEITNIRTGQIVYAGIPPTQQVGGSFNKRDLFLLQAGDKCSMPFTFRPNTIAGFGTPDEYRVRAVYINSNPGALPAPLPGVIPTATPAFANQGVWTGGRAESDEIRFLIVQPPPPTAIPVATAPPS